PGVLTRPRLPVVGTCRSHEGENVRWIECAEARSTTQEFDGVARIERRQPIAEIVDPGLTRLCELDRVRVGQAKARDAIVPSISRPAVLVGGDHVDVGIGAYDQA